MAQLFMVRDNLDGIPEHPLPEGCEVHALKSGEEATWRWICEGAFGREFDFDAEMRACECYDPERILIARQYSQPASTASAWHDPKFGPHTGVLHWLATHPTTEGCGLGRVMISAVLNKLRELGYARAVLITDDFRLPAIRLYLEFGFRPVYDMADMYDPECRPEGEDEAAQQARRSQWANVQQELAEFKPLKRERIWLWPDGAPMYNPEYGQEQPSLTAFPVEGSKGAVVVCPGGGYVMKAAHEGAPIARMLNQAGISAYVLDYRVAPYLMPAPILDANRAIRVVRSLGYEKVGILGFSAGGHLTGMAGTMYDAGNPDSPDPIERLSSRPDAFVPCYGVLSLSAFAHAGSRMSILGKDADNWKVLRSMSADLRVNEDTPPCFMWHTADDAVVPVENSLNMALACVKHGVPVELHVFPHGEHGLGLAGGTHVGQWGRLCQNWLLKLGFGR